MKSFQGAEAYNAIHMKETGGYLIAGGQREENGNSHDPEHRNELQSHKADSCIKTQQPLLA